MKNLLKKTKRGGASMFVVIFTMVILSIITIGFTRLIISETTKTTNTDLSQSAYDSALAGLEDAKMALLKYHACLDDGYRADSHAAAGSCQKLIYDMQEGIRKNDCSTVSNVLGREAMDSTENSVIVQETQQSTDDGNNAKMLQAYTCVTIQEDLKDYRTTLDSQNRLRIIPIRSSNHKDISKVRVRWFSSNNLKSPSDIKDCANTINNYGGMLAFYQNGACNGGYQTPPVLSVRLIQTSEYFDISELSVSKKHGSDIGTDTGQLYFVPDITTSGAITTVNKNQWGETANKGSNEPAMVNCKNGEWFCTVDLLLPNTFNNDSGDNKSDANTYLLISLPYGVPDTDISVEVYNKTESGYQLNEFTGVQARIDSTGRANDLYRRVEARVELVDTSYAYPEFEITMLGRSGSSIRKTFYATFNCWASDDGVRRDCNSTQESNEYSHF